jgi:isoleucyl-tRNA synthetase
MCREFATRFIDIQRQEFKWLGSWEVENPYLTMSYDHEATIAREFGRFVGKGRCMGKKPVYCAPPANRPGGGRSGI